MLKTKPKPFVPPPISEAEVVRQVNQAAQCLGITLERQNTGGAYYGDRYVSFGQEGNPDFQATLPDGRRFGLEIKRPGQRPTSAQLDRLDALNRSKGVGIWTDNAEIFFRLMPRILAGGWAEIDPDGTPHICWDDENEKGGAA